MVCSGERPVAIAIPEEDSSWHRTPEATGNVIQHPATPSAGSHGERPTGLIPRATAL